MRGFATDGVFSEGGGVLMINTNIRDEGQGRMREADDTTDKQIPRQRDA